MTPVSNESGLLDRICHKEQLGVWADELASALALSDFLKEDWTFDDSVDLSKEIAAQLRDIIGAALTHPEFNVTEALAARQSPEPSSSEVRVNRENIESLIEDLLDAQQDINLAANERMDQSLCDASALIDKTETILRRILSTLSPTVPQPGTGEEVEWTEPPLTCPHIDAAIASGELSAEVAQELATIRDINSQLRYGTWALKARLSDYQALKARLLKLEGRANG